MKILTFTFAIAGLALAGGAYAQGADGGASRSSDPYITSTGETVPNPGQSQSGGTTKLDRGIQRQDNKIDNSICKGC